MFPFSHNSSIYDLLRSHTSLERKRKPEILTGKSNYLLNANKSVLYESYLIPPRDPRNPATHVNGSTASTIGASLKSLTYKGSCQSSRRGYGTKRFHAWGGMGRLMSCYLISLGQEMPREETSKDPRSETSKRKP
ncbi:predicted protein [Sclerotinia sclerotiorum 1980 UF-70]|uniref:Uncharacterized protein n=1 Tax=Sclerotinia sclerotiorum (strain ATCC 18683 / 1980 / Ss-1) TaxID=665079 RepID=A7EGF1_SCLS1|nr:predicted protein [Sclerotinia sclerotiorum 1980 UF-70]EDO01917.1 predicted protein [Sclerotinia sclerotiorum 1980 UF-70]